MSPEWLPILEEKFKEWQRNASIAGILRASRRVLGEENTVYPEEHEGWRYRLTSLVDELLTQICEGILPPSVLLWLETTGTIIPFDFPDSRGSHREFWLHGDIYVYASDGNGSTKKIATGRFRI